MNAGQPGGLTRRKGLQLCWQCWCWCWWERERERRRDTEGIEGSGRGEFIGERYGCIIRFFISFLRHTRDYGQARLEALKADVHGSAHLHEAISLPSFRGTFFSPSCQFSNYKEPSIFGSPHYKRARRRHLPTPTDNQLQRQPLCSILCTAIVTYHSKIAHWI